jgi:peptide/nickel transport system permease protein
MLTVGANNKGANRLKQLRYLSKENPQLLWGGAILGLLLIACIIGVFYPYDPVIARIEGANRQNIDPWYWHWLKAISHTISSLFTSGTWQWQTPNLALSNYYWLGTDESGQSILILLIKGTEAFFLPGLMATAIALFGGVLLGSLSGYYGGFLSYAGRYLVTLINSFPNLILVLLCTTVFGPKMTLIAAVVGITFIPHVGEEIRRKVAQLKAEEFVMAAHAHGLRDRHILFYHIIWLHCSALIMRQLVFLWGYLVILETSLSYLGQGVLHEGFSWGKMLYDYRSGMFSGEYWNPLVVTAFVMLTMAGFYLLAEGLQKKATAFGFARPAPQSRNAK